MPAHLGRRVVFDNPNVHFGTGVTVPDGVKFRGIASVSVVENSLMVPGLIISTERDVIGPQFPMRYGVQEVKK